MIWLIFLKLSFYSPIIVHQASNVFIDLLANGDDLEYIKKNTSQI